MTDINEIVARIEAAKTQADYAAEHAPLKAWLDAGRPNLGAPVSANGTNLCMWLEQIKINGLTEKYAKDVADTVRLFKRALDERAASRGAA